MEQSKKDLIPFLFNGRYNPYGILSMTKNLDFKKCKKDIKRAINHPLTKNLLFKSAFPNSYNSVRNFKGLNYSGSIEGELAWLCYSLIENADAINNFIKRETEIENNILKGEFEKTLTLLQDLNNSICYSYWGLEIEYFLIEQIEGTESNWKYSNNLTNKLTNKLSIIFNQIFSKKVEKGLMNQEYTRYLNSILKYASEEEFEYFSFKFSKHSFKKFQNFPFLLFAESLSSIIDRYLILINVFQEIVSSDVRAYDVLISEILTDLISKIEDERLLRIKELVDKEIFKYQDANHSILKLIESYSHGEYEYCLSQCKILFPHYLNSIELWNVYVKSLIETNSGFCKTGCSEFLDNQLQYLYDIYTLTDIFEDGLQNIRKIIISVPNLSFSKQLNALVNSGFDKDFSDKYFSVNYYLNSKIINPIIFDFSNSFNSNKEFKNLTASKINSYISGVDISLPNNIPNLKSNIYTLRREFNSSSYESYLKLYNELDLNSINVPSIKEEMVFKAYFSNYEIGNIDKAISIYVDAYFENVNLVKRIETESILNRVIDSNYNLEPSLDAVVFFTLQELEAYHLFVILEMFLDKHLLQYPNQITLDKENEDYDKLLYVLSKTCSEEVLDKFYYLFEFKEEVRNERKNLLKKLIKIENNNNDDYIKELSTINQKEKIEALVTTINNSRISIKREMLTEADSSFESTYSRFVKLYKFSNENSLNQYDLHQLVSDLLSENFDLKTFDPAYLSFKSLVNDLIGNFLFNKINGLDGELSTRIRHGELENQLLNIFDKHYLISKKVDENVYTDIDYWNNFYEKYSDSAKEKIQSAIKDFSKHVDEIIQFLLKEQIQVYSENYPEKTSALFIFRFTDQFLKILYEEANISTSNYTEFIDYIYQIIEAQMVNNLDSIRDFLNKTLLSKFEKLTEDLLDKLKAVEQLENIQVKQIVKNIIDFKTDIQNELRNITDWFKISKDNLDDTMDLNMLITTSFEMSNLRNSLNPINPSISIISDKPLYILGFKDYLFIFLNIIDNIRKHSRMKSDELVVKVDARIEDNNLTLSINNNFSDEIDRDELSQKLDVVKNSWNLELDDDKLKSEGGTGFEKIKKILRHNIKTPNAIFDYKILENSLSIIFKLELVIYEEKNIVY